MWVGGKRWQLPIIKRLYAPYRETHRFLEAFCGSCSITFGLEPKRAALIDENPHLINFYKQARNGLRITIDTSNTPEVYYRHRARFNELIERERNTPEAAQLFYYLNRTGFRGLCRFNQRGQFNVPFGHRKTTVIRTSFEELHARPWSFFDMHYASYLPFVDDFVYADPPYDCEFTGYTGNEFAWHHQEQVAIWFSMHKGPVVLCNQDTPRIVELYRNWGFEVFKVAAPEMMRARKGNNPGARHEVLAVRNLNEEVLEWLRLQNGQKLLD